MAEEAPEPTLVEDMDQYDSYDSEYIAEREDDYAPVIGSFLIAFSGLEHSLNTKIAGMINDRWDGQGYAILRDLEVMEKLNIFNRLALDYLTNVHADKVDEFRPLYKRLKSIIEFRNVIAHANWETLEKGDYVRVRIISDKTSGRIQFKKISISPERIQAQTDEISEAWEQVETLSEQVDIA